MNIKSIILALIALALPSWGGEATLEWDANAEPDVTGYKIFVGKSPRLYNRSIDAGNATSVTASDLEPGVTYYFAAIAYNAEGLESPYSNEVEYRVPDSPLLLSRIGRDLTWTDSRPPPVPPLAPHRYRVEWAALDGNFVSGTDLSGLVMSLPELAPGPYTFRVVPVAPDGKRGDPSPTLALNIPAPPQKLRMKVALQASEDLRDWRDLHSEIIDSDRAFVRATLTPVE